MRFSTVVFRFRNTPHLANVYFSEALDYYTVYFEDIDLILEFGGKAKYDKIQGLRLLKAGKDVEALKLSVIEQIEELETVC